MTEEQIQEAFARATVVEGMVIPTASMAGRQTILCPGRYCVIGPDLKAFAGSFRVDEGQLYGSTEG